MTEQLHIIDWAILAIYFIVLLGIGLWASHKQRKSGKEAFRRASRSVGTISDSACGEELKFAIV